MGKMVPFFTSCLLSLTKRCMGHFLYGILLKGNFAETMFLY
jgi:hypothetical protein